jgi:hypothetical protein
MVISGCPLKVTGQYIALALFSRLTFALVRELTQTGSWQLEMHSQYRFCGYIIPTTLMLIDMLYWRP